MKLRRILSSASVLGVLLAGLVFASPAQAVVLNCGDVITTPNTTVVLTADVGPCTTPIGIGIGADNVTLDLNGHTVSGDGLEPNDQTGTIGIYVSSGHTGSANNATVKNGTVTAFNSGVYLEIVNGATVTSLRLFDNIGPDSTQTFGEGFQSFRGGTHTITGNQVVHNGPFAGIVLYGPTNNNTVTNNQVANNNILDTGDHHGGGGPIMQDIGIWLVNLSSNPANTTTNNTISSNQVSGNGLDGIQVANFTNGNIVRNNQVINNGFGQPAGNGFRDGDGVAIFGSSNLVETNDVRNNGGNGIGVEGSGTVNGKSNTIRSNIALGNGGAANIPGFDLFDRNPGCDANVWTANTEGTKNQACID